MGKERERESERERERLTEGLRGSGRVGLCSRVISVCVWTSDRMADEMNRQPQAE